MPFTLQQAELHSPDAVMNRIIRQIDQMQDDARLVTNSVFPLVELSDTTERHFTQNGIRPGMTQTAIGSESPVGDIEGLGSRDVTVETFKKKIRPGKGVDTELNSQQEILNLFNATADALMEDILMTRAILAWQGLGDVDGLIGENGDSAHPEIPSSHVTVPATAWSDHANSTPLNQVIDAETAVSQDGGRLSQTQGIGLITTPGVIRDAKLNDELQSQYDNIAALNEQQLTDAFQVDYIRTIRTQVPRTNANGEYIDDTDTVVENPSDAVQDNILEPYDPGEGVKHRNAIVGAPGQVSAFMPWFLDRLAEYGDAAPDGEVAVDSTNGWMTQTWTDNDPLASWFKAAQEIGFHVTRGDNWYVIQDV